MGGVSLLGDQRRGVNDPSCSPPYPFGKEKPMNRRGLRRLLNDYVAAVEADAERMGYVIAKSDKGTPCSCCGVSVQALWPADGKLLCGVCSPVKSPDNPPPDSPIWKKWAGHKCVEREADV